MQFTDWSVQARTEYGPKRSEALTDQSVNCHIALKVMFYLLNSIYSTCLTTKWVNHGDRKRQTYISFHNYPYVEHRLQYKYAIQREKGLFTVVNQHCFGCILC